MAMYARLCDSALSRSGVLSLNDSVIDKICKINLDKLTQSIVSFLTILLNCYMLLDQSDSMSRNNNTTIIIIR